MSEWINGMGNASFAAWVNGLPDNDAFKQWLLAHPHLCTFEILGVLHITPHKSQKIPPVIFNKISTNNERYISISLNAKEKLVLRTLLKNK